MTTKRLCWAWTTALLVLSSAGPALARQPYEANGAQPCLRCHESEKIMGIVETPHARTDNPDTPASKLQCESCHGPSATHMQFPMQVGNIRFSEGSKTPNGEQNKICLECHQDGARENWEAGPHGFDHLSCASCHSIHKASDPALHTDAQNLRCTDGCHEKVVSSAPANSSHPFARPGAEDGVKCLDCHSPHGPLDLSECLSCHPQGQADLAKESEKARGYHQRAIAQKIPCTDCHKGIVHALPEVTHRERKTHERLWHDALVALE